jgi:hypothetical protein
MAWRVHRHCPPEAWGAADDPASAHALTARGFEATNGLERADALTVRGFDPESIEALPIRGIEAPNGLQGAWRHCPRGNAAANGQESAQACPSEALGQPTT